MFANRMLWNNPASTGNFKLCVISLSVGEPTLFASKGSQSNNTFNLAAIPHLRRLRKAMLRA
jgi:hypothetical protein